MSTTKRDPMKYVAKFVFLSLSLSLSPSCISSARTTDILHDHHMRLIKWPTLELFYHWIQCTRGVLQPAVALRRLGLDHIYICIYTTRMNISHKLRMDFMRPEVTADSRESPADLASVCMRQMGYLLRKGDHKTRLIGKYPSLFK